MGAAGVAIAYVVSLHTATYLLEYLYYQVCARGYFFSFVARESLVCTSIRTGVKVCGGEISQIFALVLAYKFARPAGIS